MQGATTSLARIRRTVGRTLTPERLALKQQAISLRHDYGLSEPAIVARLGVPQTTISYWVSKNPNGNGSKNITHMEGDCLELLHKIPDKSVDVLLTDPPYHPGSERLNWRHRARGSGEEDAGRSRGKTHRGCA